MNKNISDIMNLIKKEGYIEGDLIGGIEGGSLNEQEFFSKYWEEFEEKINAFLYTMKEQYKKELFRGYKESI